MLKISGRKLQPEKHKHNNAESVKHVRNTADLNAFSLNSSVSSENTNTDRKIGLMENIIDNKWSVVLAIAIIYYAIKSSKPYIEGNI